MAKLEPITRQVVHALRIVILHIMLAISGIRDNALCVYSRPPKAGL
jgi:hypothetical protein